jgi:hypothetical protein
MSKEGTIKALGIIAIVYAVLIFLLVFGVYAFAFASFGFQELYDMGTISYILILIPTLIIALMYLVGGIAFLKYKNWGRIVLIIASFINLLAIPIGTILGIMFLIYLFNDEIKSIMR